MKFTVSFDARYPNDGRDLDPRLLEHADERWLDDFDDIIVMDWYLDPDRWHLAPLLRTLIPASEPLKWGETATVFDDPDPQDASLVMLDSAELREATEEGRVLEKRRCPACRRTHEVLVDEPQLKVHLPDPIWVNGLFHTSDGRMTMLLAGQVLERLEAAGLTRGLGTFPVDVGPPRDDVYFGIYSTHLLEPATPYGWMPGSRCDVCGMGAARFSFYKTFQRPEPGSEDDVDWYHVVAHGPQNPIVTQRVYRFLRNELRDWVSSPFRGPELDGARFGWFPDDRASAFLPERFHGVSDAPVEPLRPGEFPWADAHLAEALAARAQSTKNKP